MTLTEQLMHSDVEVMNTLRTGTFHSKRLQRVLGADELVEITIKEISPAKYNSIRDANKNNSDEFAVYNRICLEGIVEPNLKDNELMKHFQCSTPISLVEKLFSMEVVAIANSIAELSDFATEDKQVEEVKN